jgi:hypothetical protein
MATVYDELIDFIAAGSTPEQVAAFSPSEAVQDRVWDLVRREKEGSLGPDEKAELDYYAQLEHILRMAKAKARLRLKQQSEKVMRGANG